MTRDLALAASVRRDDRVDVLAHFEDARLASEVAERAGADLILVDEEQARTLIAAEKGPPVCVLRPTVDWRLPQPVVPGGGAPAVLTAEPPGDPEASRTRTLREWWQMSAAAGEAGRWPGGTPAPSRSTPAPEVLMRQAIAVISPKGGVGKTFLAVNLAASLAQRTGFRVGLLDLDLHSGDAAVHLDLIGYPTLAELLPYAGNLEPAHLARAVVTHAPSHLEVLLAPPRPEAAEMLTREHLGALLRLVKQRYDFVIVDTPPDPVDPVVLECLTEATAVILVTTLDAAALRQCRLFLDSFGAGGGDLRRRLILVLNQVREGAPLVPARAAAFLEAGNGAVRTVSIPEDRGAAERSIFEGRPLALTDPGNPVARAVFDLAQSFCPVFGDLLSEAKPRRAGLGRLLDAIKRW